MTVFHKEETSQGGSVGTLFRPQLLSGRAQCCLWPAWFLPGALGRLSVTEHVWPGKSDASGNLSLPVHRGLSW